jgi:CHAT domain
MIQTRLPEFHTAPAPPAWLDPSTLGVKKLRFVNPEKVQVIEGGRSGVAGFLKGLTKASKLPLDLEAFVVLSGDKLRQYVFSREQFWLASYGLLDLHFRDVLTKQVLEKCSPLLNLFPPLHETLKADELSKSIIAELFDIHEYSTSAKISGRAKPAGAALVVDKADVLTRVAVPDTRRVSLAPLDKSGIQINLKNLGRAMGAEDLFQEEGTPVPATDEKTIRRTPHMGLSPEGPFAVEDKFNVEVFVDEHAARAGEETVPLEIPAEEGKNDYEISVWLVGTSHFSITGTATQTLIITRGVAESARLIFEVIVQDTTAGGTPRVTALFRYGERPCGQVSKKVPLSDAPQEDKNAPPPLFNITTDAEPADMTIEITNPSNNLRDFKCLVSTHLLDDYKRGKDDDWNLTDRTDAMVGQQFQQFTVRDATPEERIAALRGSGIGLFNLAPKIFREAYWRIRDEGKALKTIAIFSQDPFVPWELMIPQRRLADGTFDTQEPLGVEFSIGRWIARDHLAPPQVVPLSDSWVFAPNYEGPSPLPLKCAAAEAKLVVDDFHGTRITPAVSKQFIDTIKKNCRALLHLVCHGSSRQPGSQSIVDEKNKVLTSLQLAGYGIENACAKKKPFVFLNACEVGRPIPALIGLGGFASEFVNLGASGVLAPLWSVKDDIAHKVAEEFYGAIKAKPTRPFADIVRDIRRKAYAEDAGGEDTYAAYCFYGDPLAAQSR